MARRGLVTLWAASNVNSLNCQFGEFIKDEDGTIVIPEVALDIALSHGFYKTPEEALRGPKIKPRPQPLSGVGYSDPSGDPGFTRAPSLERTYAAPEPRPAPKITPEERVKEATRFDLREYCEGNSLEIPPRTDNEKLRAMVLSHMKDEAAGTLKKADEDTEESEAEKE